MHIFTWLYKGPFHLSLVVYFVLDVDDLLESEDSLSSSRAVVNWVVDACIVSSPSRMDVTQSSRQLSVEILAMDLYTRTQSSADLSPTG
jgi:hypothetical protein